MKQMMPSFVLGLILFLVIGVIFWDRMVTEREILEKKMANRLLDCDSHEIKAIRYRRYIIETKENIDVELTKSNAVWEITAPEHTPANQPLVEHLLATICQFRFDKRLADRSSQDSEYGIDIPQVMIELRWDGGEDELILGNKSPMGYSIYISRKNRPSIFIGSQFILMAVSKRLPDFRKKETLQKGVLPKS